MSDRKRWKRGVDRLMTVGIAIFAGSAVSGLMTGAVSLAVIFTFGEDAMPDTVAYPVLIGLMVWLVPFFAGDSDERPLDDFDD